LAPTESATSAFRSQRWSAVRELLSVSRLSSGRRKNMPCSSRPKCWPRRWGRLRERGLHDMTSERLKYHEIPNLTRSQIEKALSTGDRRAIIDAILSASMFAHDLEWTLEICLKHAGSDDANVRCIAIEGLGHIARLHRQIDARRVMPVLRSALQESSPE